DTVTPMRSRARGPWSASSDTIDSLSISDSFRSMGGENSITTGGDYWITADRGTRTPAAPVLPVRGVVAGSLVPAAAGLDGARRAAHRGAGHCSRRVSITMADSRSANLA